MMLNTAIFQKRHFKKLTSQCFLVWSKTPCFLVDLSKQNLLQMSKIMKVLRKLTNVSDRKLYGLSYFSYTKKIRIPKTKSTTIQFTLSKEPSEILINVKIKRQIQHL